MINNELIWKIFSALIVLCSDWCMSSFFFKIVYKSPMKWAYSLFSVIILKEKLIQTNKYLWMAHVYQHFLFNILWRREEEEVVVMMAVEKNAHIYWEPEMSVKVHSNYLCKKMRKRNQCMVVTCYRWSNQAKGLDNAIPDRLQKVQEGKTQ